MSLKRLLEGVSERVYEWGGGGISEGVVYHREGIVGCGAYEPIQQRGNTSTSSP